jgi:peptidoglycan-associated lipoprotein
VSLRTLCCGLMVTAIGVLPAAAQGPAPAQTSTSQTAITQDEIVLQGETTPRPALPTIYGDTGFWYLPTAETLPSRKWSFSLFRANWDQQQGLTDVNNIGLTGAIGIGDRVEVFGSWGVVRLDRDVRPTFVNDDPKYGGISQDYPWMRRGWSKTLGGPINVGAKFNLISQSRGDAMALALRVFGSFPAGADWSSTNDTIGHVDVVTSKEFNQSFELTGTAGGVLRGDPDDPNRFDLSDGVAWGVGARFPSRSRLSGLAEFRGEWNFNRFAEVLGDPYVAEDGSIAPTLSRINDPVNVAFGLVYQAKNGLFAHTGLNYTQGVQGRSVGGTDVEHHGWGWDIRFGWHPGVTPPRERVHMIKETTTVTNTITQAAPAPPAANRNPTFSLNATCDPLVVEPGGVSRCNATATDPDGDAVTYRWTAPSGSFGTPNAAATTWTAAQNPGSVPLTVTATDTRGGSATSTITVQVTRRVELVFEDVHFDFDRYNLRSDALRLLDDAVAKLMQNPNVRITIEGHCDSVGTSEYNLALGERRANSVRDYLTNRGVTNARLRTVSYGEDRPIADNNTTQGRAQNRRAHLVVIMETVQ